MSTIWIIVALIAAFVVGMFVEKYLERERNNPASYPMSPPDGDVYEYDPVLDKRGRTVGWEKRS